MIEDFSSGYYRADLTVEEYDDGPIIDQDLYNFIDYRLYAGSTAPIMMRVGLDAGATFEVGAEAGIPPEVLAVPEELASGEEVFLLKSGYAQYMGDYDG